MTWHFEAELLLILCIIEARDLELRQAIQDRDAQLSAITQSLAEYKHRAHTAEVSIPPHSYVLR